MTQLATARYGYVRFLRLLVCILALAQASPQPTRAHELGDTELKGVGVDERLGAQIPVDLLFRDQSGKTVYLSQYLSGKPFLLILTYYACPTLCPVVFRNLSETLQGLGDLSLGKDFRIITVSIDPNESQSLAREKSAATYAMLGHPDRPGLNWPFLTGDQREIAPLADAVGFRYRKVDTEFAHPSVLVVATPQGRVSRYLYGIEQRPQDLKLALLEASGGKIGSSQLVNRALLYCFHYDPVGKKYVLFASRLMTTAMLVVLLLTAGLLALLWNRERKRPSAKRSSP